MQLKSNNVELRKFRITDSDRLTELANNKNIATNLSDGFPYPYTKKSAKEFIQNCIKQDPTTFFAIEYLGEHVGNISLSIGKDIYQKSAEIGYFIGEPYWNKGIASTSVNLITEYGFKELGIMRIHTGIFEYNKASMRVLEKCGFVKEGIFKNAVFKNNKIWNEHRYSKII